MIGRKSFSRCVAAAEEGEPAKRVKGDHTHHTWTNTIQIQQGGDHQTLEELKRTRTIMDNWKYTACHAGVVLNPSSSLDKWVFEDRNKRSVERVIE